MASDSQPARNASTQNQANRLNNHGLLRALDEFIWSSAQEGSSGLLKVRPFFSEDRPVACVREDPELRLRYGLRHFHGELDAIERIAVALHDERASPDRREIRRREVHVVVARGKRSRAFEDRANLRIPA